MLLLKHENVQSKDDRVCAFGGEIINSVQL